MKTQNPGELSRPCLCVLWRSYYWLAALVALVVAGTIHPQSASRLATEEHATHWMGTWAAAPQHATGAEAEAFHNQTLRLIVHTSAGGKTVRVKISNVFGDQPLIIGSAHVARRAAGANIEAGSDRTLLFGAHPATTIPAGSLAVSDPVELEDESQG
jgi:hypothetical protein